MPQSLTAEISRYIAEEIVHEDSVADVDPDADLTTLGVLTSLSLLRVVAWTGERFGIPVGELEIDPRQFTSINSIARFITTHSAVTAAE